MRQEPNQIIRFWKDARFRETQQVAFELNPAGVLELDDALLAEVSGSSATEPLKTIGCCSTWWDAINTVGFKSWGCCVIES